MAGHKPPQHPYDKAREALKAQGNSVFGVRMLEPINRGSTQPNGRWGSRHGPLTNYTLTTNGFPGTRYAQVRYNHATGGSLWSVNIPVANEKDADCMEEVKRQAEVFMDLININREDI